MKISVTPNLRSIINSDGAIILDVPRNQIVTLNSTAAYIWEKLTQNRSIEEIIDKIAQDTKFDPHQVENDVREFLGQLVNQCLIQI